MRITGVSIIDYAIILIYVVVILMTGWIFSRRNKNADQYFTARSRVPGWVAGFSLMATLISSMSFLATPGFAFKENWRYIPTNFLFMAAAVMGIHIFMPIFRRSGITSSYEYLERRFGSWARVYAAIGYVMMQSVRLGLIAYTVSLPLQLLTGLPIPAIILLVGIVVSTYTIIGGLEGVIWTDMIQGIGLILGGLICLPVVLAGIPGGFPELMSTAYRDGKMSLGSFRFSFTEITFWVMIFPAVFNQLWCVEQTTIQRYVAPKTEKAARRAIWTGVLTTIPVWVYFTFLGTALYVFYKFNATPGVNELVPEQVLPFFILTKVPAGLVGIVIIGLLAAAQSSLAGSMNASASIVVNDFYRRFFVKGKTDLHYLKASKWFSSLFGFVMIGLALLIHYMRTMTLQDLGNLMTSILSSGIFGLFALGVLTKKVKSLPTLIATLCTVALVVTWLALDAHSPAAKAWLPHKFWMTIFANIFLFSTASLLSLFLKKSDGKPLANLTLHTLEPESEQEQ